jgi:hypothetical protein
MRIASVGTAFLAHGYPLAVIPEAPIEGMEGECWERFPLVNDTSFRGAEFYLKQACRGNTTKVEKSSGIGQPFLIYT